MSAISPPALPLDGRPDEAEILSRIALVLYGVGADGDPSLVDEAGHRDDAGQGDRRPHSPVRVARSTS